MPGDAGGCRCDAGRCGGLPGGSAGLPRRWAPRNDNGGDGNGRGGFVTVFGCLTQCCHCEEGLEEN